MYNIHSTGYSSTVGVCRGGESPGKKAGVRYDWDKKCKDLCDASVECAAYAFPVKGNWCATYTSRGAVGNGEKAYNCYTKSKDSQYLVISKIRHSQ